MKMKHVDILYYHYYILVLHTVNILIEAAKKGISSECSSGKMNMLKVWKGMKTERMNNTIEISEEYQIETKIKEEKTNPIQSTSSLHTLLLIANKTISFSFIHSFSFFHSTLVV